MSQQHCPIHKSSLLRWVGESSIAWQYVYDKNVPHTILISRPFLATVLIAYQPQRGRGKMRLYGLLGGQVGTRVQSMWQTRGVWEHFPLGNFDFGPFIRAIWWNLALFSHKHNLPFIVSLNPLFTCKIAYAREASQSQGRQAKAKGVKPKPRGGKCPLLLKETLLYSMICFLILHKIKN